MISKNEVIAAFGEGWAKQDPAAVMSLIAKEELQYFESAFGEPTSNWVSVSRLWNVIRNNQSDVVWWHEILLEDDDKALAHVKVQRTLQPSGESQDIDAAFLFGFDNSGKINYFRQWRTLAE